jgi:hypothetical protein
MSARDVGVGARTAPVGGTTRPVPSISPPRPGLERAAGGRRAFAHPGDPVSGPVRRAVTAHAAAVVGDAGRSPPPGGWSRRRGSSTTPRPAIGRSRPPTGAALTRWCSRLRPTRCRPATNRARARAGAGLARTGSPADSRLSRVPRRAPPARSAAGPRTTTRGCQGIRQVGTARAARTGGDARACREATQCPADN